MKENRIRLIKELSDLNGAPGFEDDVCRYLHDKMGAAGFETFEDNIRNLYIYEKGTVLDGQPRPKQAKLRVTLDSHSDECGYVIQSIKKSGLLKFLPLGTMLPSSAIAQAVRVRNAEGKYIKGVITSIPVHFLTASARQSGHDWEDLFIDVGATSAEEIAEKFQIEVGAPVVPDTQCTFVEENEVFIGKSFDNRIGVAMVTEVLSQLKGKTGLELVGAVSTQEEIGGRGAVVSAKRVLPDLAIVFEGTPADDSFTPDDEAQSCLRKGPQLRHLDRTCISHPKFTELAIRVAKEHNIPLQRAVRSGGGTNAALIHTTGLGIPTIVLATPCRYVHSHHCIVALSDFEAGVKLAVELIREIERLGIDPATY